MKQPQYPQWFEGFWGRCYALRTDPMGTKGEAFEEAKKLDMGPEDVENLVQCFKNHTDNIRRNPRKQSPHTHMCRWLKRRWFENEICGSIDRLGLESLPASDQRKARAAERYRLKHLGDGVESPGGSEADVGGTGQHNLGILESKS